MRDTLTQKSDGYMPRSIAITLLTSNQSKTNSFRKRCLRATERVSEPVSRSTTLNVSAPKTGQQRLQARLSKASVKQLVKWVKRTQRRGNHYQDLLFETQMNRENAPVEEIDELRRVEDLLTQQIAAHDGLCQALQAELDKRRCRGKLKV